MAQQMLYGSHYDGSVTVTNRKSHRYAVINQPFNGLHLKPQDPRSLQRRKLRWELRRSGLSSEIVNKILGKRQ